MLSESRLAAAAGGLVRYDDLSSLYIFPKICTNAPGLVAATPQALPTGERPFSQ